MNYTINLTEQEYFVLYATLTKYYHDLRNNAERETLDYFKKGYERDYKELEEMIELLEGKAKKSDERKYVLIRQDSLNDVQDIFIFDTLEEAESKMDEEYKNTLAWLIKNGVGEDADFIKECGERYKNLICRLNEEDHTYLWSIHLSD